MKKIVGLILSIGLLFVLVACGTSEGASQSNGNGESSSSSLYDEVMEEGVITVGTEGTYPPFTFHDENDNLTGYDIEVLKEVANRLDLEVEFNETQWDSMFAGLNSERFDVIANQVGIKEDRLKKYDFSDPYTYTGAVVVAPTDSEDINSFSDLEGKVAAQSLTSNYADIAKENGAEIEAVEGLAQSIENLKLGRVDVTVNGKLAVLDYLNETNDQEVEIVDEEEDVSESAFAFRKGNEKLVEAFNEQLEEMRNDGTLTEISENWFNQDVSSQ